MFEIIIIKKEEHHYREPCKVDMIALVLQPEGVNPSALFNVISALAEAGKFPSV